MASEVSRTSRTHDFPRRFMRIPTDQVPRARPSEGGSYGTSPSADPDRIIRLRLPSTARLPMSSCPCPVECKEDAPRIATGRGRGASDSLDP
jgi:hypothetical protein